MIRAGLTVGTFAFLFVLACQKKDTASSEALSMSSLNHIELTNELTYSDSIFYPSGIGTGKIISPISKPVDSGYFAASLPGLELDSATGRINTSRSESGLRYMVYYLSMKNEPIDSTPVTISGIDYTDHVYDFSQDTSAEQLAIPVYNMNPDLPLPCNNGGNGQGCKFDETDLNYDGLEDIPGANRNKLFVDVTNGTIDLKKSLNAGVFGLNPFNGKRKDVMIYYRLNDGSGRVLNKITVRLVYFRSRAMIPESMLLEINSRNTRYQQNGITSDVTSSLSYYTTTTTKPKRPPLIVIVSGQ